MRQFKSLRRLCAVTLLELMVVVLIISVLATIATGVYSGETQRARIAATRALIRNLEVAITRYEMDTGVFPPSGSGSVVPPAALDDVSANIRLDGSGYLHLALSHSVNGNALAPASSTWHGPYITFQEGQVDPISDRDNEEAGMSDILDPWGMPIYYIASTDYAFKNGSFRGGTMMFTNDLPAGGNPNLPAPNPFAVTETYYNPRTFQLISYGPDARTLPSNAGGGYIYSQAGAAEDDITNFGY